MKVCPLRYSTHSLTQCFLRISGVFLLHFGPIHAFALVVSKQLKMSYAVVNLCSHTIWLNNGKQVVKKVYIEGDVRVRTVENVVYHRKSLRLHDRAK